MRFANYSRKSIYSDKSDSVDNQARMSKEYAEMHFPGEVDVFLQYCDEDFTGANTARPDLQRLMNDIALGLVDVLIVYQLDRLSRDVKDFSNIYSLLEKYNVKFISLKENIDTTTPIGKAMMYVSVVFAQMERETIANRVTDNMAGLAKKGYWVGGNPPHGYVRERIVVGGKKHVRIVPSEEGKAYVINIFETFLEGKFSLRGLEIHFKNQKIRTPRGKFFSTVQLHQILTMPYCAEATGAVYDYYAAKGCRMDEASPRDKWDGTKGVMVYGRTTERNGKHQKNPPEKWMVCLGAHEPFIPADMWLKAQAQFGQNKFEKVMKYDVPLLKGILRCSCGSGMQVARKKKVDSVGSWYYCTKRATQGPDYPCDSHHIKTELIDNKVIERLRSIERNPELIKNYTSNIDTAPADIRAIESKMRSCEQKINRLTESLAIAAGMTATKYILAEITRLDLELQALNREHSMALTEKEKRNAADKTEAEKVAEISRLIRNLDTFPAEEKNGIMREIVSGCTWDGENLKLVL